MQEIKGLIYVIISGLLVFWLARRVFTKYEQEVLSNQLGECKNLLETTLNNLGEAVFVVGPPHRQIISCNEAVSKVFGYETSELIGHTTEMLHQSKDAYEEFGNIGEPDLEKYGAFRTQYRMKRKDGTIIETENTVINLDCDGGWREGVISIIEDITERVRAQEALAERERHYRLLTENQLDVIWAMDLDFNFTYVNAAAENLLGYTPEEAVQMNLRDICSERVFKHLQSIIEEKTIKGQLDTGTVIKTEYLHKDGSIVPVEIHGKTLYEDSGQPTGFQGSTRDISERLHLEAQVRQAQKLESIGTLASGIAHEISNPVHGIKGYAGLIKDIVGENAKVGEYVQQIQEQTEQIHTIVANLLGLARKEEQDHPMEPASLSEIVDATVSLTRTVMRHDLIAVNVNVPATLPPILCHKQQIQQVVLNLLTNARDSLNQKYPEGDEDKKIDIIASLRIQSGEQWTRLTIEDHGHGILPEVRERMYEPFYTTKAEGEGTGLGMWIIYSILKDHNANIKVETEEGRYTRFHIDLPTVTEEKA